MIIASKLRESWIKGSMYFGVLSSNKSFFTFLITSLIISFSQSLTLLCLNLINLYIIVNKILVGGCLMQPIFDKGRHCVGCIAENGDYIFDRNINCIGFVRNGYFFLLVADGLNNRLLQ